MKHDVEELANLTRAVLKAVDGAPVDMGLAALITITGVVIEQGKRDFYEAVAIIGARDSQTTRDLIEAKEAVAAAFDQLIERHLSQN